MEQIFFRYDKQELLNNSDFIFDSYSRIDGYPIYHINIDIDPSFIYKFISINLTKQEQINRITVFLRNVKINYLLNKKPLDEPMVKFINFIQFYVENYNNFVFVTKMENMMFKN